MNFLEQIRAELKAQGLPESLATVIAVLAKVESEAEVSGAVAKFKSDAYPAIKAEADRVATTGIKTALDNYEKKHNLKDGKIIVVPPDPDKGGATPPDPSMPEWAKALIESQKTQIDTLSKTVQGIVQKDTENQKFEQAKSFITKTQIPAKLHDKWAKRIDANSETSVEDQIKALEADYLEDRQIEVNQSVSEGKYVPPSNNGKGLTEADYLKIFNGDDKASDPTVAKLITTKTN